MQRTVRYRAVGFFFWVVSVAVAAPALAQDDEARALFLRGDAAYAEGRYEAALAFFGEAYDLSHRPGLLYNIANTLERLGRTEEAIARLQEFLPYAPPELRDTVERRIAAVEERTMRRLLQEDSESTSTTSTSGDGSSTPAGPPAYIPWGPIVMYSLTAIAAGFAIGFAVEAKNADDRARPQCRVLDGTGTLCPSSAAADINNARSFALVGDISMGVAGAALAAGVVWTVVEATSGSSGEAPEDGEETAPPSSAHVTVSPFGAGIAARVEF